VKEFRTYLRVLLFVLVLALRFLKRWVIYACKGQHTARVKFLSLISRSTFNPLLLLIQLKCAILASLGSYCYVFTDTCNVSSQSWDNALTQLSKSKRQSNVSRFLKISIFFFIFCVICKWNDFNILTHAFSRRFSRRIISFFFKIILLSLNRWNFFPTFESRNKIF
jgi:hypothetical protein